MNIFKIILPKKVFIDSFCAWALSFLPCKTAQPLPTLSSWLRSPQFFKPKNLKPQAQKQSLNTFLSHELLFFSTERDEKEP
jgi:hypothetical protein